MSLLFELSSAVRTRRSDMGLTQVTLAKLSGLSRATVNQVEKGSIKDLSLTRAAKLLAVLGMSVTVSSPHPRSQPAEDSKNTPLDIAARTASVSYKVSLQPAQLREVLTTGVLPKRIVPHVYVLLDEAPVSLLASVVEQLHREEGVERTQVWKTMRSLANEYQSIRAIW